MGLDGWDRRIAELDRRLAERDEVIAQLRAELQAARAEIADLKARLGTSSRNSSKPPSSDPPGAGRPTKPPTGRKPGGQPGHPRHERRGLQPDRVVHVVPEACECCGAPVLAKPVRTRTHQVIDVPAIKPDVTDYVLHARGCSDPACGHVTEASLPPGVPSGSFGAGVAAIVSLATGRYRLSKRLVQNLLSDMLGIEVCVGSIANLEQQMSAAMAAPVEQAREHVRQQSMVNIDETGWYEGREGGRARRAWLWVAVTSLVTVFRISLSRGTKVAMEILGADFTGSVGSDRWSAYNWLTTSRRQLSWSHLARDFQGFVDRGGLGGEIGQGLLDLADRMFEWWHRVRDGTLPRACLQRRMKAVQRDVIAHLELAVLCAEPKTAGMAQEILKLKDALFTFVDVEGVEPTNNVAERQVRPGVMWRKLSFGTQAADGSRYVERILTAVATLKQQKRNILEYLIAAYRAWLLAEAPPSLLPNARSRRRYRQAA